MGTEVHYSMRNVNEDWHLFYGDDNSLTNDRYFSRHLAHEKHELKQKMLQHEAIFQKQVYELHRLYTRQRDMMEQVNTSSSSSHKWSIPSFPSIFSNSPSKVRKKLFDLELPPNETEEEEDEDNQISEISSHPTKNKQRFMGCDLNEPLHGQDDFLGASVFNHLPYEPGNCRINASQSFESNKLHITSSHGKEVGQNHFNSIFGASSVYSAGPSWGKPNDSSTRNEVFEEKRHKNGTNTTIDPPSSNGFSSSGSKELSNRFDYRNKIDGGSQKMVNFVDLTDGMDLNTVQNEDQDSRKPVFPWLKAKKDDGKLLGIDINVAWDGVETDVEVKNHFDLNSCVTEDDEELLVTESCSKKMRMEIDLETLPVSEEEEKVVGCWDEEVAAEAMVEMVSCHVMEKEKEKEKNPLWWFVSVIEMDEYEIMALQVEDSKQEDYMPTPLVPPDFLLQEEGDDDSRPRRGQARRGRPRRDFQRDILPGIASLSKPEITEDLHIFGGLMRATGHSWNWSIRKKPGRPKLKTLSKQQQVEVMGYSEERSLTGWGKTTRRPPRQRCNSFAV